MPHKTYLCAYVQPIKSYLCRLYIYIYIYINSLATFVTEQRAAALLSASFLCSSQIKSIQLGPFPTMRSTGVFVFLLFVWLNSAQKPPYRIVHLGDSFSAGNGARRADGSRDFHSVSGCFRSLSNWGSRFAASLEDVFSVTYINRARGQFSIT